MWEQVHIYRVYKRGHIAVEYLKDQRACIGFHNEDNEKGNCCQLNEEEGWCNFFNIPCDKIIEEDTKDET
jgi:hypothetical protein